MIWFVLALLAAIFEASSIIIEKKSLIKEHALEFCCLVSLFAFLISFSFINNVDFNLSLNLYILIFIASLFVTFGYWLVAKGIRHMDVSIASPLLNFSPAIVFILAVIFLGEKLKSLQILGILILVFGSYILNSDGSFRFFKTFDRMYKSKAVKNILLGILIWSVARIFDKYLLNWINQYTYLFIIHFFIMLNFLVILFIFYDGFKGIKHGIKGSLHWLLVMAALIVVARLSYLTALKMAYLSLVFVIFKTSNLLAAIIGGNIFHERALLQRIIAAIIMVVGVYLVII